MPILSQSNTGHFLGVTVLSSGGIDSRESDANDNRQGASTTLLSPGAMHTSMRCIYEAREARVKREIPCPTHNKESSDRTARAKQ